VGSESTTEGADKLEKLAARTGAAFVVPDLVQQVDRLFDPTVYDQSGMGALLQSQVPFARRENKPALNVLGEPVQSGPFHYWASKQSQDPLWRFLADRKVFVPETAKTVMVGNRALGNEYYIRGYELKAWGRLVRSILASACVALDRDPPVMVEVLFGAST